MASPTAGTLHLAGELDMARESEVLNLVVTLDPLPDTTVKLDLADVTFVDSRGLVSILKTHAYLRDRHCSLLHSL